MNKISIRCYKDNWENRIGSDVLNFFFIGYIFLTLIFRKGFSGEVTIKSSDVNLKVRSQLSDIYRQEHFRWEESCKDPEVGMGLVSLAGVSGEERCRGWMMEGPGLPSKRDGSCWGV